MIKKQIHQYLPSYAARDAIGNEANLIRDFLRREGFDSEIYCDSGYQDSDALSSKNFFKRYRKFSPQNIDPNMCMMFHYSVGSTFNFLWSSVPGRRWLRYHNVTPAQFFTRLDELITRQVCGFGRIHLPSVCKATDFALADSEYNAAELFPNQVPTKVVPVVRDYSGLTKLRWSENRVQALRSDGIKNCLFVGRVSPNKCQHDILQVVALWNRTFPNKIRAILAGSFFSGSYQELIKNFAQSLKLKLSRDWDPTADILCLGSITDEELASLYRSADVYMSLSEHEGFGVPLVEAMHFDLPIIAHRAAAVPEVVGDAAVLVDKFDWEDLLKKLQDVLMNQQTRDELVTNMKRRRQMFAPDDSLQKIRGYIRSILGW